MFNELTCKVQLDLAIRYPSKRSQSVYIYIVYLTLSKVNMNIQKTYAEVLFLTSRGSKTLCEAALFLLSSL